MKQSKLSKVVFHPALRHVTARSLCTDWKVKCLKLLTALFCIASSSLTGMKCVFHWPINVQKEKKHWDLNVPLYVPVERDECELNIETQ